MEKFYLIDITQYKDYQRDSSGVQEMIYTLLYKYTHTTTILLSACTFSTYSWAEPFYIYIKNEINI